MTISVKLGFIGGGNMARAIAEGVLKKGIIQSSQIIVSSPSEDTLASWNVLSIKTTLSNAEVINEADIIILAFKPQHLSSALVGIKPALNKSLPRKLFVSVLAGTPSSTIYQQTVSWLDAFYLQALKTNVQENPKLIRVMPNILAMICEGCSAIAAHDSAEPNDVKVVEEIFSAVGKCEVVPEHLISAVTGVSGSGPAYIYMVIEALSDGGVKQGLPRDVATTFAAQTVLGAAKMVLETQKPTSQLKNEVCSAGGTTIHAVHVLEKHGLRAALMSAVEVATIRGNEMASMTKK